MIEESKWYPADILPEPGDLIIMRLDDESIIEGVRPNYIDSTCYHDMRGNRLDNVILWSHK